MSTSDMNRQESDTMLAELSERVSAAEDALLEALQGYEEAPSPRTLQRDTRDDRSSSVMSIAFWRLVNSGKLELDQHGQVHPGASSAASAAS
jgi:hypothetical protein